MIGNVEVVFNPISGGGAARRSAYAFERECAAAFPTRISNSRELPWDELDSRSAVVVFGGDGTLRDLLPRASEQRVLLYHAPMGNENLFARYFGMTADTAGILQALKAAIEKECFFGTVNDHPFFSMVSIGLDSEVVERIAQTRDAPIGHRGYILPLFKSIFSHRGPHLTARLSKAGSSETPQNKISGTGWFVIGNSCEYGVRLAVTPEADPTDKSFQVRFYDYRHWSYYARWIPNLVTRGRGFAPRASFNGMAEEVYVSAFDQSSKIPVQADGDHVGNLPVVVRKSRKRVRVLVPGRALCE